MMQCIEFEAPARPVCIERGETGSIHFASVVSASVITAAAQQALLGQSLEVNWDGAGGVSVLSGPEAPVVSVLAGELFPDLLHTAAGDDRVAVGRRDPDPPADVLLVGTVAQGISGPGSGPGWVTERVPVQQQGLQQGAAQHQVMKQWRGGNTRTPGPPATKLLLAEGSGTAATAHAPCCPVGPGLGTGFGATADVRS